MKKQARNACPLVKKKGVPQHSSNDQGNIFQDTAMKFGKDVNQYVFQTYVNYGMCRKFFLVSEKKCPLNEKKKIFNKK